MDDELTPASPPVSAGTVPPRPRLERPLQGRILAGVSLGLARHLGLPIWAVRIGFIVLTFFGGLGPLAYLAAWLFIPSEGRPEAPVAAGIERLRGGQAWLGLGLVFLAVVIALSTLDFLNGGLVWAIALVVFGILLYRGDLNRLGGGRSEIEAPSVSPVPAADYPSAGMAGTVTQAVDVPEPIPSRPRSRLGRFTLGALAVTIGLMSLFDVAGVTRPTSRHYFSAALVVIGTGLLIGTLFGRSRGLIVLGLFLTPFVIGAALIDEPFGGAYDDLSVVAGPGTTLQPSYDLTAGRIVLDLRDLELDGRTVDVAAHVGAGMIEVYVPDGAPVDASGSVRLGEVDVLGDREAGWAAAAGPVVRAGTGGALTLDLSAGIGAVYVYEAGWYGFTGRDGTSEFSPETVDQLEPSYSRANGLLVLDLSNLDLAGESRSVDARVVSGNLRVIVPDGIAVSGRARVTTGRIELFDGSSTSGTNLSVDIDRPGDAGGSLDLSLQVTTGTIYIQEG